MMLQKRLAGLTEDRAGPSRISRYSQFSTPSVIVASPKTSALGHLYILPFELGEELESDASEFEFGFGNVFLGISGHWMGQSISSRYRQFMYCSISARHLQTQ